MDTPIPSFTRSGYMAYFDFNGAAYALSTRCNCAGVSLTISSDGAPHHFVNATAVCPKHGEQHITANRCYETPPSAPSQVFAWAEQRHARDRRVAWGMHRRAA